MSMRSNFAAAFIFVCLCTSTPASARYAEPEDITSTETWSHQYHFPKYSEYLAVVVEDSSPASRSGQLERIVLREGGIRPPNLVNAHPLPKEVTQVRYDIPRARVRNFEKALAEKKDVQYFLKTAFADTPLKTSFSPDELRSEKLSLETECPKLDPADAHTKPLAALCREKRSQIETLLNAYQRGEAQARLLVAVVPPGTRYVPDGPVWSDEHINESVDPTIGNPDEPAYWAMSQEGRCTSTTTLMQISIAADSPLSASNRLKDQLAAVGANPLPDGCRLPSRLQPHQKREDIILTFDYAVPTSDLPRLDESIRSDGRIVYDGPLNVRMWEAATAQAAKKFDLLSDASVSHAIPWRAIPTFRTFIFSEIARLRESAFAYKSTSNSIPVHFVVMRAVE